RRRQDDQRLLVDAVRVRPCVVHRPRRHPQGLAAAAHAADVADERDLRDCRGRRDSRDGRRLPAAHPDPGRHRAVRVYGQHRQRLPDHRPDAEDVQDGGEAVVLAAVSQLSYIVASALFIFALHWMNTPATARKGVYAGVAGTAVAVLVTWADPSVIHHLW